MTSLFNALWFVGSLIAAGVSYGTQSLKDDWAWRIPSLLQAGPSLLQIIFILYSHHPHSFHTPMQLTSTA